jgi:hypothetical protein
LQRIHTKEKNTGIEWVVEIQLVKHTPMQQYLKFYAKALEQNTIQHYSMILILGVQSMINYLIDNKLLRVGNNIKNKTTLENTTLKYQH